MQNLQADDVGQHTGRFPGFKLSAGSVGRIAGLGTGHPLQLMSQVLNWQWRTNRAISSRSGQIEGKPLTATRTGSNNTATARSFRTPFTRHPAS